MRKLDEPSPTEFPLLCAINPEAAPETFTRWAGCRSWCTFRSLGLPASVQRQVRIKQRQRGYDEAAMVESFVILNAAGGECLEDFDRLHEEGGLEIISKQQSSGTSKSWPRPRPTARRSLAWSFQNSQTACESG